jgi:hypothetical protein
MRARRGADEGVAIGAETLRRIRHAPLRAEAQAALARGERVRLLATEAGEERVETLLLGSRRAAQCSGTSVVRGEWTGERLLTDDGGHALGADGACFCRDCEMAGGFCVDDDE